MSRVSYVHAGLVPYEDAWQEQRRVHAARVAGEIGDTVLLLEHPPVFTAGKRTLDIERPTDGTPVIDVDRGGKITWHGPGQLVGYPIMRLPEPVDVVAFVRRTEQLLIDTCAEFGVATRRIEEALIMVCADLGLDAGRVEGRSGVWASDARGERKVAAIGIRV